MSSSEAPINGDKRLSYFFNISDKLENDTQATALASGVRKIDLSQHTGLSQRTLITYVTIPPGFRLSGKW
jgi:hypothetical protein